MQVIHSQEQPMNQKVSERLCFNYFETGRRMRLMASGNATFLQLESYLTSNERTFLTGVYILLTFLGLFGNGIVIYVVVSLGVCADVPANIFILSQAFSDFGTALSLLIYIIHMYVWIWDVFYWYAGFVWLASLGSLFLLTFNRLLSVFDSFGYSRRMTSTRAKLLVVLNWILSIIVTTSPLINSNQFQVGRYYILVITAFVILFNVYLFREARIQSAKIKQQNRIVTGLQKNMKEDFKSVRTLALVGGTFLVCCLPFTIVTFIYGDDKLTIEFQRCAAFAGTLMPVNAILDPVIYYFRSAEFRAFYKRFKRSREGNFGKPTKKPGAYRVTYRVHPIKVKPVQEN